MWWDSLREDRLMSHGKHGRNGWMDDCSDDLDVNKGLLGRYLK